MKCRPKYKGDVKNGSCRKSGEFDLWGRFCCKWSTKTVYSSDGIFTLQNSWGVNWGENGYYRAEFDRTGPGVCMMYQDAYSVVPDVSNRRFTEWAFDDLPE